MKATEKGVLDVLIWCHLCLALPKVKVSKTQSLKFLTLIRAQARFYCGKYGRSTINVRPHLIEM